MHGLAARPFKTALVFPSHSERSFRFTGQHIYELDPAQPSVLGNPCGMTGLASAIRGDFLSWKEVEDPRALAPYDAIIVTPKLEFQIPWLRDVRRRYPAMILVGQFEENVRKHKIWCRSWAFQRDFYEFAQTVDVLTTFHANTLGYYELFARGAVKYLPHPYPTDWARGQGLFAGRAEKDAALLKAGYIHGRIGSDGFADVVPFLRVAERHDELTLLVSGAVATTDEVIRECDIRERQHVRRLNRVLLESRLARSLPGVVRRVLAHVLFEPAAAGQPDDPMKLRGFDPRRLEILPRMPWEAMLRHWRRALVAIDVDSCFTVGRNVADAAATGTPIIGGNSDFQRALFPDLEVDELDYAGAEKLTERLLADTAYYDSVVSSARSRLDDFSYDATRDRFQTILAEVLGRRSSTPRPSRVPEFR